MKAKAVAAGVEHWEQEGAESASPQPQLASTLSLDEIQQRAYELHLERRCVHGYDLGRLAPGRMRAEGEASVHLRLVMCHRVCVGEIFLRSASVA